MTGDVDNNQMLFKKEEKETSKKDKKDEKKKKTLIQKIKESRPFLAIIMLLIGIFWTVAYFIGKDLYQEFMGSKIISFTNVAYAAVDKKEVEKITEIEKPLNLEEKIKKTFKEHPEIGLALIKAESGLDPEKESNTDKMKDGRAFSIGLAQVNLTVHKIENIECYKAFNGKNKEAQVKDENLYQQCVKLAKNPDINLRKAREIYEGRGFNFSAWGAYTNGSYKRFLN